MRHKYLFGSSAFKIGDEIERAIRDGVLRPGDKIESVREAAAMLSVNRNTVAKAYGQLRDRGLLVSAGGRGGMHVASGHSIESDARKLPSHICDLASGNVDPQFLPSLKSALATFDRPISGYDSAGDDASFVEFLREQLSQDGLDTRNICLTSGALDAIERCIRAHVRPGSLVLVEDPGYPPLLDLLRSLGMRLKGVQLDDDGPRPESLEEGLAAGARALIITPRAQNPYGCDISPERSAAMQLVLQRHPDTILMIDDHWGNLAEGPLTFLPSGARNWLYVRSVSKFLGPDLRVAVTVGDDATISKIRRQFTLGPRWVSRILQDFAHKLWADPRSVDLVSRARDAYRARREQLLFALRSGGVESHGSSGIHIWLPVQDETVAVQMLMGMGWAVQPGQAFRLASAPGIRISLGNLNLDHISDVAAAVQDAVRQARQSIRA